MKLIWDSSQFKIIINNIELHIASENHPPFPIKAIVEEQDTSLVLEPDNVIHVPNIDKPAWYMANTLEHQKPHKPSDIIFKPGSPVRLWAIIHDLEHTPSWREEWIEEALKNILELSEKKTISSIRLPVLGAQFGHFEMTEFIKLLVKTVKAGRAAYLKRIWLVVPDKMCQTAFIEVKKLTGAQPPENGKIK